MNINGKIVYGLERISDALKALLWEKAKNHGISPIQIQLLLFISNHRIELSNVTHLAREFNLTKPTVSDAVKVLIQKGYLSKDHSSSDKRSYNLIITDRGNELFDELINYNLPLLSVLNNTPKKNLEDLYSSITLVIDKLYKQGILQVQRSCYGCRFYNKKGKNHYCNFLDTILLETEIRLDCPEHEKITRG